MNFLALGLLIAAGATISAVSMAEVRIVDQGKPVAGLSPGSRGTVAAERLVAMVKQVRG